MSSLGTSSGGSGGSGAIAKYNLVLPTYIDGATADLQTDANGNLRVTVNALGALSGQKNMAGSIPVVLASDQASIPVTLGANQSVNAAQINGVAPLMGAGNGGTGSLRVNIASDQVAIPVSQSGSNWSENVAQINGVAPLMGAGNGGTGSLRVNIASDQVAIPVTLGANQSVNAAQINGVAPLMGAGNTGTGSLRVTIATDQVAIPVTPGKLSVQFSLDTKLFDASSTNINGSAGAFVQVVASTTTACKQIKISETTGQFIGVYTGGAGSEVFAFSINPGMDDIIEHTIASGTRISLRALGASAITTGNLTMMFQN